VVAVKILAVKMLPTWLRAAAVLALLAGPGQLPAATPASAQMPNINLMPELGSKTPEEKEKDAIAEKAYRESLRKIPDTKVSSDPWGNVRGAEAPKPASPKPKTKTGSTAN
jgi:hypothetical protein